MDYDPGRLNHPYFTRVDDDTERCPDEMCGGRLVWNGVAEMWDCEYGYCPMSVDQDGRVFKKGKELV